MQVSKARSATSVHVPLRRVAVLLVVVSALVACAQFPSPSASEAPAPDLRISRVLIAEGLRKLGEKRYEDASRIFNAGLKFAPDNAHLHFLNALSYHLLYLRGQETARELAVTGYESALGFDPAHYQAALQLGRIEYEAKRYAGAIEAFQRAVDIDPESADAHLGLAMAAYYAQDLGRARAAILKAAPLLKGSAAAAQAEAMVYAGLGDEASARKAVARFEAIEPNGAARSRLVQRVNQWRAWHASLPAVLGAGEETGSKPHSMLIAQASGSVHVPGSSGSGPQSSPSSAAASPAVSASPSPPSSASAPPWSPPSSSAAVSREPAMPRWTDCDSNAASAGATATITGTGYGAPSSADETTPLPALPVPCKGAGNPRMAVLDVAIVRTEDTASTSHGVNLLNGLTYVFNRTRQVADVVTRPSGGPETRTITITRQRTDTLSGPNTAAGLAYSLNIANATDSRSEVLAQPSLLALDRQSSTFFSGRNITLGIAGQAGGASTFTDRPVGVSLSVTPTFVDDETMLVAARAARSFVEQVDENVAFGQTMQTSRNSVSANVVLKYGQTLILSGLSEQEVQRATDGVPVLQDIPLLQYLFRNRSTQTFRRSVLVLITPRRPQMEGEQLAEQLTNRAPAADATKQALLRAIAEHAREGKGLTPSLALAYDHALQSKLFLQFRSGDMKTDDWSSASRLDTLLNQVGTAIYF